MRGNVGCVASMFLERHSCSGGLGQAVWAVQLSRWEARDEVGVIVVEPSIILKLNRGLQAFGVGLYGVIRESG